jgi:antitoxin component HigA of HigAB toxin-antitoxin module
MSRIQIVEQDGKPVCVVVPMDLWERIREAAEDAEDIADLERFDREDDGIRFPAAVAHAMADGATPVRAWREHKGLTLGALAEAAGLSKPFVSQIEGGRRTGSAATLKKLAAALGVPVGALVP